MCKSGTKSGTDSAATMIPGPTAAAGLSLGAVDLAAGKGEKNAYDAPSNAQSLAVVSKDEILSGNGSTTPPPPPPRRNAIVSAVVWVQGLRLEAARDCIRLLCSQPWLNQPLLGRFLTQHVIDINIVEALLCAGFVYLVLFWEGAQKHERGAGLAIYTAFLLGTVPRNSLWYYLLGVPFERMIKYHRWAGTFALVPMLLHALAYTAFKTCTGEPLPPKRPGGKPRVDTQCFWGDDFQKTGMVAFIAFGLMFLTSLPIVRRRGFELFYYTHALFIAFVVAGWLHFPKTMPYHIIPPLALYGVDRLFRLVQSRFFKGRVQSVASLPGNVTRIVVDKKSVKHIPYRGGQYVFVCFPEVSLLQWHPVSIATCPSDATVEFFVRGTGHWSRSLATTLTAGSALRIEGAYGGAACPLNLTETVVLFAGGVGVVPLVSILKDLCAKSRGSPSNAHVTRVKKIVLVWAVKSADELTWFARDLEHVRTYALHDGIEVHVQYYVTRGENFKVIECPPELLEDGTDIKIEAGRPDVRNVLRSVRESFHMTRDGHVHSVVGVHVCGPDALAHSVLTACSLLSNRHVTFVGGKESFEL